MVHLQPQTVKGSIKVQYTLSPQTTTYLARVKGKQIIHLSQNAENGCPSSMGIAFGTTAFKPCIQAVCMSRPELVHNPNKDHALTALDAEETHLLRTRKQENLKRGVACSPVKSAGTDKIWEGKGMLSWILQDDKADARPDKKQSQSGDDNEDDEDDLVGGSWDAATNSLTVTIQLTERPAMSRVSFFQSMRGVNGGLSPSPVLAGPSIFSSATSPSATSPAAVPSSNEVSNTSSNGLSALASLPTTTFQLNIIEPTPLRPNQQLPQNGRDNDKGLIKSSSSPLNHTAASSSRTGAAPPAMLVSENTSASTTVMPDRQQVAALAQKLLGQLKASDTTPEAKQSIEQTMHSLMVYLAASEGTEEEQNAPPSPDRTTCSNTLAAPHAGLCIDSLDAWLSSVSSEPPQPPSQQDPVAERSSLRASQSKRKTELEGPAETGLVKTPKLKYDPVGCSNCGIHNTMTWRKSKKGKSNGSRICNACGVYYNRTGHHRPITEEMRQAAQDHAANDGSLLQHLQGISDEPSRKRQKTGPLSVPASPPRNNHLSNLDSGVRKSPRFSTNTTPVKAKGRSAHNNQQQQHKSDLILSASPNSALDYIMSDAPSAPSQNTQTSKARKPKQRHSSTAFRQPTSAASLAATAPSSSAIQVTSDSMFDDAHFNFVNSLGPDISSMATSEPDFTQFLKTPMDASTNLLNGMFDTSNWLKTSVDSNNIFSANFNGIYPTQSDDGVGRRVENDITGPIRVPPSSPPARTSSAGYTSVGFALSDSGDSPNQTPTDAGGDTPQANLLDISGLASGMQWSQEALAMLSNALTMPRGGGSFASNELSPNFLSQDCGSTNLALDDKTLQDLLGSIAHSAGSPASSTVDGSFLDVRPVADVNAGVANTIWRNEVMQFAALHKNV